MEFKPGDILHRKFSDAEDFYCVIGYRTNPFTITNTNMICLFPFYKSAGQLLSHEVEIFVREWYEKVDLNNYKVKERFLPKIKNFLIANLGNKIEYDLTLDNLTYIEIMAELKKYEKDDIVVDEKN